MDSYKHSERDISEKLDSRKVHQYSEFEVVARFRELLQQGNKIEALGIYYLSSN